MYLDQTFMVVGKMYVQTLEGIDWNVLAELIAYLQSTVTLAARQVLNKN